MAHLVLRATVEVFVLKYGTVGNDEHVLSLSCNLSCTKWGRELERRWGVEDNGSSLFGSARGAFTNKLCR